MIKPNHVTTVALATLLVLAVTAGFAFRQVVRARDSFRAEVAMQQALASVRQLQIATRALQSERADIEAVRRDWDEARSGFHRILEALDVALESTLPDRPQLKRIVDTWGRMEGAHEQIAVAMTRLRMQGLLARIGTSSLVVTYQEMLGRSDSSDRELGEIGLLLFQLEQVDRLVIEVEFDLRELARVLEVRTRETVRGSFGAAAAALAVATVLVALLLVRIARLYSSLESDNAARRAAEQAARASEGDLHITLNSIGDAVFASDAAGRLVRLNPAASALTGLSAGEALGRPVRELFRLTNSGLREELANPVDLVIASGRGAELHENVFLVRRDGTERQVSAVAAPIVDDKLRLGGVVLAIRDITEPARLEEQLRRVQKLESMGQLAGGVAHDFNNILQVVKANVAFLADDPYLSAEARQYLAEIELATNRAADLTRQLLALGRRQTLQFKELDPAELVRAILQLTRRVLGEHIEIGLTAAGELDWVKGDPGQLEQVVLNLCVNARDAMPGGGRLTLTVENATIGRDQVRAWPWARTGRCVRLTVSDSGSGIPRENLVRIFEPFYTTKPTGKGTGLGLSVVQGIVQQHGGFISVYSEVGLGTTFHVHLPSHERPTDPIADDSSVAAAAALPTGSATILLVEDDAAVRQVAQSVLKRQGYRVLAAGDGEEACALAEANREAIAIAVLDVVMPRMGGVEVARRLQTQRPGLPILLCTGYAGGIEVPELSAGWGLLHKPYSNAELILAVQKALGPSGNRG